MDDVNDECFLMLPNFQADSKQCMSSQIHKLSLGKSKITDISVIKMSTNFGLTEIKLQFCSGITDVGITALVNNCPLLRVINLSSCKITDRAIVAIATQSRNLRSLDLSWCGDFTDDGLLALIPEYGIERVLEQLNLVWCPQLTDTAVAALAHISSLKSVDISGCSDVSKNTVLLLTASGITVRS